jgi:hypothetical protein
MPTGEIKVGDEKFYHECGNITKVKVLEVNRDDRGLGYKLQALSTKQSSRMVADLSEGEIFNCWAAHDAGAYAGWYLMDE